ncbi:MAG: tRNA dihydrouridine synthase DusB [Clostridia bacterium]|nr:tRNA dihydrouridine synthase DusB [Clostridia bacterium]
MRIGTIELPIGAGLAPMAGVSDAAMRMLCHEQGAAWSVSEMLSAKGWIYSQGKNINALQLLERLPNDGIVGLQLFGREPDMVARAVQSLEPRKFDYIDLNFGCPAPKITGNGEGSAMMREPKLLEKVVAAAVGSTKLPVTAKFRAGWDGSHINAVEIAQRCEYAGASAITVHPRTRDQQYSGYADWRIIQDVKRSVSIPVIGNGDIRNGVDAVRMIDETGCDGVMVGRGAMGNPWIFAEIRAAMLGKAYQSPDILARKKMLIKHIELETRLHGPKQGLLEMRKHIAWYVVGLPGASKFRERINRTNSLEAVYESIEAFFQ